MINFGFVRPGFSCYPGFIAKATIRGNQYRLRFRTKYPYFLFTSRPINSKQEEIKEEKLSPFWEEYTALRAQTALKKLPPNWKR